MVLALAGCDSRSNLVPVSGIVLLDGEPLVGASVNTQPISTSSNPEPGSGSFGKTDAEGHYSLELVDPPIAGAVLGEHRVTITRETEVLYRSSDERVPPPDVPWPTRYNDGSLRLTIPAGGTDKADFELTLP